MAQALRIVHYLNQFFGGIGGEDKASEGPQLKEGLIGPGRAVQDVLKERGEVVATVICGDNYFVERTEEALAKDPQTICVCCPYCMTMFEDGLKDKDADDRVRVMDIAEIVADRLGES